METYIIISCYYFVGLQSVNDVQMEYRNLFRLLKNNECVKFTAIANLKVYSLATLFGFIVSIVSC